jgi:hypothetical protein
MSDETLALILAIAVIALFFVWVPLLNLVCPPCARFLARRRLETAAGKDSSSLNAVRDKIS